MTARACRPSSAAKWARGGKGWTKAFPAADSGWPSCGTFPSFTGAFSPWTPVPWGGCWPGWSCPPSFRKQKKQGVNKGSSKLGEREPGRLRVPMLSNDKTGLLKAFLGNLPGPAAARLAMAVEVDQLMDGHALPHQDILEGLRPVLRREHYERAPTPLRLFCRPFQDLLIC